LKTVLRFYRLTLSLSRQHAKLRPSGPLSAKFQSMVEAIGTLGLKLLRHTKWQLVLLLSATGRGLSTSLYRFMTYLAEEKTNSARVKREIAVKPSIIYAIVFSLSFSSVVSPISSLLHAFPPFTSQFVSGTFRGVLDQVGEEAKGEPNEEL
jgi:hypothetical protein